MHREEERHPSQDKVVAMIAEVLADMRAPQDAAAGSPTSDRDPGVQGPRRALARTRASEAWTRRLSSQLDLTKHIVKRSIWCLLGCLPCEKGFHELGSGIR